MNIENEWVKLDNAQKVLIAELKEEKKDLIIQLEDAGVEIAKLQLEVRRLEDGKIALRIKLLDAEKEVARLSTLLTKSS